MFLIILALILIAAAIIAPKFLKDKAALDDGYHKRPAVNLGWARLAVRVVCGVLAVFFLFMTSYVNIGQDSVGHMKRKYLTSGMEPGQIIADTDQMGPQARILPPGFRIMPFVRVLYKIEELDLVEVPQGQYGYVTAKDGLPMPKGQFIAPAFNSVADMIDAEKFLGFKEGSDKGVRGPQLTVLTPGKYRINLYLFEVTFENSTPVPAGFVAVIKSNVGKDYTGDPILPSGIKASDLSVPIVPEGYRGVWAKVKTPGEYYINKKAYDVTLVNTRVQTWKYLGGYTKKWIDLVIGDDGKIQQIPHEELFPVPKNAADSAIVLRVQGWDVFMDSRVQVQVTPANAPFVVASVGNLDAVENKIITPNYRSILRNVVSQTVDITVPVLDENGQPKLDENNEPILKDSTRPREVLDLLYHRKELEKAVAAELIPAGAQAGLTVQWVRFGDPAVPPSLLIPGKRKQLAQALMETYQQEKKAQTERVLTEKERAQANEQSRLMESQINITVAENNANARRKAGLGEEAYMKAIAKGQKAQANVLGQEKAFELAYVKVIMDAASKNPDIIKYPATLVMGGDGLTGAAAILGANNLTQGLKVKP